MGQPVKLSDALMLDARLVGEAAGRPIAGQIEFWARVGRAVEFLLGGDRVLRLKQRGEAVPLSKLLATVESKAGRERLKAQQARPAIPALRAGSGAPGPPHEDRRGRKAHGGALREPCLSPDQAQVTSPFDAPPNVVAVEGPSGAG